jgi:hypothetical protein
MTVNDFAGWYKCSNLLAARPISALRQDWMRAEYFGNRRPRLIKIDEIDNFFCKAMSD